MEPDETPVETSITKTLRFRRQTPVGALPGTLETDPESTNTVVRVMAYGPNGFREEFPAGIGHIRACLEQYSVTWVDVAGLRNAAVIREIGEIFGLHPLALEDVINVHQRVKLEQYEKYLFLVARMVESDPDESLDIDQLSLFLGSNFVLTFQERPGDRLDPVRERLRTAVGRIRERGADYLTYALLDLILDRYFPIIEGYGERLDDLEAEVVTAPRKRTATGIHAVKKDLIQLRRAIWPLRETISVLLRDSEEWIVTETRVYFRDCYDHAAQLIDLMEIYREVTSGLLDEYLSSLSNRLNEVMKVLTIIATIFMPLGFIAGLYGMNFNTEKSRFNMPELNWSFGYPFALGIMASVAIGMLLFFWKKGWLGSADHGPDPKVDNPKPEKK